MTTGNWEIIETLFDPFTPSDRFNIFNKRRKNMKDNWIMGNVGFGPHRYSPKWNLDKIFDNVIRHSNVKQILENEIEFDVPGYNKADLTVKWDNNHITITGDKKDRGIDEKLYIGNDVDNVMAKVKDGILTIILERGSPKKRKTIEVE